MLGEHDGVDLAHGAFHRVVDDKVIVGVGGLKLDLGTHEALLKKNGAYAALYNSQFGAV